MFLCAHVCFCVKASMYMRVGTGSSPVASHLEDALGPLLDDVLGPVKHGRVEVPLDADLVADAGTGIVDRHGPIQRHDVDTSLDHSLEESPRLGNVDDDRDLVHNA